MRVRVCARVGDLKQKHAGRCARALELARYITPYFIMHYSTATRVRAVAVKENTSAVLVPVRARARPTKATSATVRVRTTHRSVRRRRT